MSGTVSAGLAIDTAQKLDTVIWLLAELQWKYDNHIHITRYGTDLATGYPRFPQPLRGRLEREAKERH